MNSGRHTVDFLKDFMGLGRGVAVDRLWWDHDLYFLVSVSSEAPLPLNDGRMRDFPVTISLQGNMAKAMRCPSHDYDTRADSISLANCVYNLVVLATFGYTEMNSVNSLQVDPSPVEPPQRKARPCPTS